MCRNEVLRQLPGGSDDDNDVEGQVDSAFLEFLRKSRGGLQAQTPVRQRRTRLKVVAGKSVTGAGDTGEDDTEDDC